MCSGDIRSLQSSAYLPKPVLPCLASTISRHLAESQRRLREQSMWQGLCKWADRVAVDLLVASVLKNAFAARPLPIIRPTAPYCAHNAEIAALMGGKVVPWQGFRHEVQKYETVEQLSLLSDDAPAGSERVHFPPIYHEGLDVSGFPPAQQLARLYVKSFNLLDARELMQVAETRLLNRQCVGSDVNSQ
jgi:hypothetical protein